MLLKSINDAFWDERLWFPNEFAGKTYGWNDLQNEPGSSVYLPQLWDLHWSIVFGAFLVFFRKLVERFVLMPVGSYLGIPQKQQVRITPNHILETAYRKNEKQQDLHLLSKQTDWTARQIEAWFRKRKKQDATPRIRKFCNSGWTFMFYTTSHIYGLCLLWNKPWFGKTEECWIGWPNQHVSNGVYWYYMIELGFYFSLIFTLFSDHKRADFVQMMIHHFATIVLIYTSWITNYVRIGTLVLLVHDAADPWLEIAKLGIYLKWKKLTDVMFAMFVLVWTVARHIVLPFVILYSTTLESLHYIIRPCFIYYLFNFFLYLLMILTCIWSYSIYKMVYKTLTKGDVEDSRSDSEEDDGILEDNVENWNGKSEENRNNNLILEGNTSTLNTESVLN